MLAYGAAPAAPLIGQAPAQDPHAPIRYVQVDPILGKQSHKQQYELRDGKLCPVDLFGRRESHKPCLAPAKP